MSTREVHDCDRCGQRDITPIVVYIATGRSPDAAGGPSTIDDERFDLCPKCAAASFAEIAKNLSHEQGAALAAKIRTIRKAGHA